MEKDAVFLFVCKGNSGRSQMAEAFFNCHFNKGKAISAGTVPDKEIHPWTIQVMKEIGIDVTQQKPKLLTEELIKIADKVIIMDSDLNKDIPFIDSEKYENWQIDKLSGKPVEKVREIRDQIRKNVERLTKE